MKFNNPLNCRAGVSELVFLKPELIKEYQVGMFNLFTVSMPDIPTQLRK